MVYIYKCDKCAESGTIDIPLGQDLPKELPCEKCGGVMKHDLVGKLKEASHSIIIPESFKATSKMYEKQKLYGKFNLHEKTLY